MRFFGLIFILTIALAACGGGDTPIPTRVEVSREPSPTITETVRALPPTTTPSPTITNTPTETYTPTETPTLAETLSPIQETEIAFIARRTQNAQTATANAPTPTPTITYTPSITFTPSITPFFNPALPDNPPANHIIFSSDRAGSRDIWLIELDGSNPRPLVLQPDDEDFTATCSPNGQQFVFDSDFAGDREIYLGNYQGEPPRPLTDTEGENYAPVWSPLDDAIAFVSTREEQSAIWIMDTGGGNAERISLAEGDHAMPQWSPDGTQVFYVANYGSSFDIYAYNRLTEETRQITDTPDIDEQHPALGFDLTTIAYSAPVDVEDGENTGLWLIEDGGEPQNSLTAEGDILHPVWIEFGNLLTATNLGGVTHILLTDLVNTRQAILTNTGLLNVHPQPCYIQADVETAILPTGVVPTQTPSPTPELITQYTAVVNPGADWQTVETTFTIADLEALAPNDFRLSVADAQLANDFLLYAWTDDNGNIYRATVVLEAIDGALEASLINYSINNEPADFQDIFDLPFVVQEGILTTSIPIGRYRLEALNFSENDINLIFSIPPDS